MGFSFGRRAAGGGSGGGGGGNQTLGNIPGTLATTKGGTGGNYADLDALKTGLGVPALPLAIGSGGTGVAAADLAGLQSSLGIGAPHPTEYALPSVTKFENYTVDAASSTRGQLTLSGTQLRINARTADESGIDTALNTSIDEFRFFIIEKDASNMRGFVVTAETGSSGVYTCAIDGDTNMTIGSIANGDSVDVWVAPAPAGYRLGLDITGTRYAFLPPSPFMVYARQSTTVQVTNDGTNNWRPLNFNTKPWKFDHPFVREGSHCDTSAAGVAYLGAHNSATAVNAQARLEYRYADTAHGTYNAWSQLSSMTQNNERVFHSKVAAGGNPPHADYWTQWTLSWPMDLLPTAAIGKFVQFRVALRRENTTFPRIEQLYDHNLSMRFYDPTTARGF